MNLILIIAIKIIRQPEKYRIIVIGWNTVKAIDKMVHYSVQFLG